MPKVQYSAAEKKLGEISEVDRIIKVDGLVVETDPFTIDDGSGRVLVRGSCPFHKGNMIRVIGTVSVKENGSLSEITPAAMRDISKLDLDLFSRLQKMKARLVIRGRLEK